MTAESPSLHGLVQRALMRCVAITPHGALYERTDEGARVSDAVLSGLHVACEGCGLRHPAPGVPKYSLCQACRRNDPKVDFIERPA